MSGNGNSTLSLLCSAFGPFSTPYTVLRCNDLSTPTELRCAYRAAALQYHPDRLLLHPHDNDDNGSEGEGEGEVSRSTLKFQAVSAAYQVLMDEGRRAHYDRTGEVLDDNDDYDGNNHDSPLPPPGEEEEGHTLDEQQQHHRWENFFRSVFAVQSRFVVRYPKSAEEYRGSETERRDVLRYYKGCCGGDINKVLRVVPYGKEEDISRWMRDIVDPYFGKTGGREEKGRKGMAQAERHSPPFAAKRLRRTVLEDSSSSEEEGGNRGDIADMMEFDEKVRGKIGEEEKVNHSDKDDDDDDDNDVKDFAVHRKGPTPLGDGVSSSIMSKRDKMDYRAARMRKMMAEKEMGHHSRQQPKKAKAGGISDELLSNLEEKYGQRNQGKKKKKTMSRAH